jgi:hypothetical protein
MGRMIELQLNSINITNAGTYNTEIATNERFVHVVQRAHGKMIFSWLFFLNALNLKNENLKDLL